MSPCLEDTPTGQVDALDKTVIANKIGPFVQVDVVHSGEQWWAAILKNESFKAIQIPNF
jgi:hypothetical protein